MSRYKTPLRYPGGKQKLAPFMLELLVKNDLIGGHYAEAYAGGAGIAIDLLMREKVSHVHLNDSCTAIYAFWCAILDHTEEFCRRISSASMTIEEWRRQRDIYIRPLGLDVIDVGFSLFYLNRCNRSGIPLGGIIGGLNQTGQWKMDARFPRNELITRIESIAEKKEFITLKNLDAEAFILKHVPTLPEKSLVYCDPPYYHKADRLYKNHYNPADHSRIAKVIQGQIPRPWVVSYDNAPEIQTYYGERTSFVYDLQYNAARAYKGKEIFIFSPDLKLPKHSVIPSIDYALNPLPLPASECPSVLDACLSAPDIH